MDAVCLGVSEGPDPCLREGMALGTALVPNWDMSLGTPLGIWECFNEDKSDLSELGDLNETWL